MSAEDDLRARFLAGMSHAAQTVNVVTTDGPAGRAGVTVSAMTSVSADTERPTLLVCVHRESATAPAILANGVFCVNVLRDDQTHISDIFAGRFRRQIADKFEHAEWVPMPSGAPRVVEPLVAFDCRMVSADLVGTHHVFFGEVGEIFIAGGGSPLLYARRAYGAAAPIEAAVPVGLERLAEGKRLALACVQTAGASVLPGLLRRLRDEIPDVAVTLIEGDQTRVQAALAAGEAELALMWDNVAPEGFASEPVAEFPPYALVPADDPLAAKEALEPGDFGGRPMVLLTTPPAPDLFLTLLREQGGEPRVAFRSGTIETVRGMVGQGLGLALLAVPVAGELTHDGARVVRRPLAWAARPVRLALVRREGAALSPAAECFAWYCRDGFGAGADRS
ncbi:MAG TPA: LysR substrate-binding domain-containing protein [Paracoccaceae bacterium]|nr:LysR substrate-binding domain-containing protein [Paracoccaceae bacterium]